MKNRQIALCIIEALGSLPDKHKELIILRDMQGLSYEEIEKITAANPGTIKSRLARARGEMQEELKGTIDGYK